MAFDPLIESRDVNEHSGEPSGDIEDRRTTHPEHCPGRVRPHDPYRAGVPYRRLAQRPSRTRELGDEPVAPFRPRLRAAAAGVRPSRMVAPGLD
ncbi:hypothetical protein [Streptomyces longwoodensis]|uniref:hypothetical protein n=1 Tax=Streptomyces longwoodensis TaxID=68231 RepID=UPI00225BE484|nr:hypothetical protein [Streptomyces longwoodensis]MCX4996814.1 hypothetical protein [Streptomyces longwoodensis]